MQRWTLQCPCTRYVFLAPSHKREQNVTQGFSLFRYPISVAHGMLLIRRLSNEARLFQSFQAVGKNVGRNSFGRILQLSIGHITPEQVPNHEQRPLVALLTMPRKLRIGQERSEDLAQND